MPSKESQIIAVAEELLAAGTKPTYKAILDKLGGVGSNTTVKKALDAWRESKRMPTVSSIPASDLPAKLGGRLNNVANEIWKAGVAQGEQTWAAERTALLERLAKVEAENERLRTAVELQEIVNASFPVNPSQEEQDALQGALAHLTGVKAELEEKILVKDAWEIRAAKAIRILLAKQHQMQEALTHAQGELNKLAATER